MPRAFTLARISAASVGVVGVAVVVTLSCGPSRLPAPAWASQPTSALFEVPYPPPPARVEEVPPQPTDDAVWIDGEWVWQARRYAWRAGRWVVPPPAARFAPWTTVRDARGTLFLAQGTWRDERGVEIAPPAALAGARPRPGTVITPEGDRVPASPILFADAATGGRGDLEDDAGRREPLDVNK